MKRVRAGEQHWYPDCWQRAVRAGAPSWPFLSGCAVGLRWWRTFSWWGARAHTAAEGGGSITHFLLYLNDETFGGMQGEALAQELRAARAAGLVVVLVHEQRSQFGAVDFDRMFHVTPADLVKDGLYRQIATSLHDSPLHVAVAVALIVEGLGAKRTDASRFSGV